MTDHHTHPDTEQLQRLQAELLDPEEAARLQAHLRECPRCQAQLAGWQRLGELATLNDQDAGVTARLAAARRAALAQDSDSTRHWHALPLLATAASVMLMVSLGVWQLWPAGQPAPATVGPVAVQTAPARMAQQRDESVPEVYEDLDFYLWLAGSEDTRLELPADKRVS